MRGTPHRHKPAAEVARIIPAYAGNTHVIQTSWCKERDHPRVCGEHHEDDFTNDKITGSSPRMRGTPVQPVGGRGCAGIIPAYAGNTFGGVGGFRSSGDHPRVCGEHLASNMPSHHHPGSSPRMRGTHGEVFLAGEFLGIIPAYAGNTLS